jgi:penicillin-binding protein 1A
MLIKLEKKFTIFLILFVLVGLVCGAAAGAFFALTRDLPQIRSLESFRPSAVTRFYSADQVLLGEIFVEKRDVAPFKAIPENLKKALVCTEDRSFYHHSGVDIKGVARAVVKDILAGGYVEGASTITQQLAKTLFLTHKKTLARKIKEAILAFQLERRYTKDEILGLYLNQVYFGSGAYGVQSAANLFFGKSLEHLSLAESALIAGMPKSPSRYSPLINPELAIKRRNIVLSQMKDTELIDAATYHEAFSESLELTKKTASSVQAPYFIAYLKSQLEDMLGSAQLYKGGLIVFTTLDFKLQKAAEAAVEDRLSELENRMIRNNIKNPAPECAVLSLDVQSGSILSMVGGRSFAESTYNRAVFAKRQPGSAFKPILYACAIEQGFPQSTLLLDAPVVFPAAGRGKVWKPENFSRSYSGEMSFRKALAQSKNIPAVRLIEKLGVSSVINFAHGLGVASHLSPYLSLALGSSEMTLIELTAAFAVFPNQGNYIRPFGITEIQDHQGRVIWRVKPVKKMAMSRAGAAIMTDMLTGVIKEGTGRRAQGLRQPVAGKTGTTNEYNDALFIGFSPSVVTGVWVGQDTPDTLGKRETGAKAALPVWMDVMKAAEKRPSGIYFDFPDDVVRVRFDSATGLRASENNPDAVEALFIKGTAPGTRRH